MIIKEKVYGPESIEVANIYAMQGGMYMETQQFEKAAQAYRRQIQLIEKIKGPQSEEALIAKEKEKLAQDIAALDKDIAAINEDTRQTIQHNADATINLDKANQDLDKSNQNLDKANQDLDKSNQNLDKANQDLDKANQDLDKANQDLDKANQDLDKAKQKLATMKRLKGNLEYAQTIMTRFRNGGVLPQAEKSKALAALDAIMADISAVDKPEYQAKITTLCETLRRSFAAAPVRP